MLREPQRQKRSYRRLFCNPLPDHRAMPHSPRVWMSNKRDKHIRLLCSPKGILGAQSPAFRSSSVARKSPEYSFLYKLPDILNIAPGHSYFHQLGELRGGLG